MEKKDLSIINFFIKNFLNIIGKEHFIKFIAFIVFFITSLILALLFFPKGSPIWKNISDNTSIQQQVSIPSYTIDRETSKQTLRRFEVFSDLLLLSDNPVSILRNSIPSIPNSINFISKDELSFYLEATKKTIKKIEDSGYIARPFEGSAVRYGFILKYYKNKSKPERVKLENVYSESNINIIINRLIMNYDSGPQILIKELTKIFVTENLIYTRDEIINIEDVNIKGLLNDSFTASLYVLIFVSLGLISLFSYYIRNNIIINTSRFYLGGLFFIIFFLVAEWIITTDFKIIAPKVMFIPTSFFVIFFTWIFNRSIAIIVSIIMIFMLFIALRFDAMSLTYLMGSVFLSSIIANRVKNRAFLLLASLLEGVIYSLLYTVFALFYHQFNYSLGPYFVAISVSVISSVFAIGIAPLFEEMLNLPSYYRLLHLSNFNEPILRRMQAVAPGSYNHSLNVGVLAEAACQAIGANSLLARVGSYYHDIGKTENPDYFTENQLNGINPHDNMKTNLSVTVIRNHVKHGQEIGKKLGLPSEIIAMMDEHHGKSAIKYFYNQALTESSPEKPPLLADFCYTGNWPRSKETTVVAIADTLEAACRSLKKPTTSKIRSIVKELIENKIKEGFLTNSPLTFKELTLIQEAFVQGIMAQHHERISYTKEEEEN